MERQVGVDIILRGGPADGRTFDGIRGDLARIPFVPEPTFAAAADDLFGDDRLPFSEAIYRPSGDFDVWTLRDVWTWDERPVPEPAAGGGYLVPPGIVTKALKYARLP